MADGEKGGEGAKGGEGEKGGEKGGEQKKDELIPKARLDAEVSRRHAAEEKLKAFEKSQADGAEASLKEQNKFKELWEKDAPRAKLADELEKSVGEYFNGEIEGLSDEQKALIPDGALHTKLAWVKKAKTAGIFGKQKQPDKTFNGKTVSGLPPEKWYLELEDGDERVGKLTTAQYQERKNHKKAGIVGVHGGF